MPKRDSCESPASVMIGSANGENQPIVSVRTAGALALVFLLACARMTPAPEAPPLSLPAGDPDNGRAAFVLHCARCHRVSGDATLPAPLSPVPFVLGEGTSSRPTDTRLLNSVLNPSHVVRDPHRPETTTDEGRSAMADLTDELTVRQLVDVVAYLRRIYDEGTR